jgi:hypothetical protein
MDLFLPTSEDLAKLPIRAVAAYAERTSRRLSAMLRGAVRDAVIDNLLREIRTVCAAHPLGQVTQASIAAAVQCLAEEYASLPVATRSPERFRAVFSLTHAALAAISVIEGARRPDAVARQLRTAVTEAERAVRAIDALDNDAARSAAATAREEYEVLLRAFGEHLDGIVGGAVDCFAD